MLGHEMDWLHWASIVVPSMLAGVAVFWAIAGYYHLRYYVRRAHEPETWKCQPKRFLRPGQNAEAAKLSSFNLALGGLISGTMIYAYQQGWEAPKIYTEVAEHGWAYTLITTALLFVVMDASAYYVHRLFHIKALFRRFHRIHHRYVATTPFVVVAVHPVELLSLQAASFLPIFIVPLHFVSVIVVLVYVLVFNIIDHSGVKLSSSIPWQGPSMYHDDHHRYFHVNFGQHLMIWDRLHGTLRRQGRRYGVENFGGKGVGESDAPFVDYQ